MEINKEEKIKIISDRIRAYGTKEGERMYLDKLAEFLYEEIIVKLENLENNNNNPTST